MADDPQPKDSPTDKALAEAVKDLVAQLAKGGSPADASITQLIKSQQARNQELTAEIEALRKKLPADGAVVLEGDALKVYEAYQALGKPDELTKLIEAGKSATEELAGIKAGELFRQAAKAHGYHEAVLERLAKQDGLAVTEIKVSKNDEGEEVTTAFVRQGEKDAPVALTEYAEKNWKDLLPALTVEPSDDADRAGGGQPTGGYPHQRERGGAKKDLSVEDVMKKQRASGRYSYT